jgi:hypothetical protein
MAYFYFGNNPYVQNIGGTSGSYYTDWHSGSWIGDWRSQTGISNPYCSVYGCGSCGSHGAHVRINDGRTDGRWTIIPMCPKHNNPNNGSEMKVKKNTRFVNLNDLY